MLAWSAVTFKGGLFPGSSMHQITSLQTVLFSCLRLIVVLNNPPVRPHQETIDHNTFQLNCFLLSGRKQSHDEPELPPAADLWWRIFPGNLNFTRRVHTVRRPSAAQVKRTIMGVILCHCVSGTPDFKMTNLLFAQPHVQWNHVQSVLSSCVSIAVFAR